MAQFLCQRSRIFLFFFVLLLVCSLYHTASAQDSGGPTLLLPFTDVYSPATLSVRVSSVNLVGDVGEHTSAVQGSTSRYIRDFPSGQTVQVYWNLNGSDSWTVDFYANYTVPMTQTVWVSTQSSDSEGLPLSTGPFSFLIVDTQTVWIRFMITTRLPPHFPSPEENTQWVFRPGSPLISALDRFSTAIYGNPSTGERGLKDQMQFQTMLILLLLVAVVVLAIVVYVSRKVS